MIPLNLRLQGQLLFSFIYRFPQSVNKPPPVGDVGFHEVALAPFVPRFEEEGLVAGWFILNATFTKCNFNVCQSLRNLLYSLTMKAFIASM